jgi:anti-sigma factor RsiW
MSLDEELSRLLAGDLTEPEASALRARIAHEPDVAHAYAQMAALVDALGALPETAPAPPLRVVPLRSPLRRAADVVPWLLAAAACVAWLLATSGTPDVLLASGESWVQGDLTIAAADVTIDLEGTARIRVEPPAFGQRVAGKEDEMTRGHLLAGVAGAAVTVAVVEGVAVVRAAHGQPVELAAGDTQAFGGDTRHPKGAALPTDRAALERHLALLQHELAVTQDALQLEQFSGALTRGQLAAVQGTPQPWPAKIHPTMTAEHFGQELAKRFADVPGVEVRNVDCSEYPCIAALEFTTASDVVEHDAAIRIAGWVQEAYGDDHSLSMDRSRFVHDDAEARYIVFGAHAGQDDPNVQAREKWRIDSLVEQLGEDLEARADPAREGASPP